MSEQKEYKLTTTAKVIAITIAIIGFLCLIANIQGGDITLG